MNRSLTASLRRASIRLKDAAKYSPWTSKLALAGIRAKLSFVRNDVGRANLLARAYRLAESNRIRKSLRSEIHPYVFGDQREIWREKRVGWARYPRAAESPRINRTIVLK